MDKFEIIHFLLFAATPHLKLETHDIIKKNTNPKVQYKNANVKLPPI